MGTADVRLATASDVPEIARIQADTWRAVYADTLGSTVESLDHDELARHWAEAVEHPDTEVHVAFEGEFTVGFCVAGPAPEDEVAAADGTVPGDAAATGLVATILVEPRWGRRGHGGRLLAAAAAGLVRRGARRGITWAAESDSATLNFFRRAGWHPDNTVRTLDTGEGRLRELRLTGGLDLRLSS